MEDKIILDKEIFKALAVDSRINILKLLNERKHILSEIAESLGYSNSTIKEHLDVLVKADLVKQIDDGHKWKYYKLTFKGKNFINPKEVKVLFAFAISVIGALTSAGYLIKPLLFQTNDAMFKTADVAVMQATPLMARAAPEIINTQTIINIPLTAFIISIFILGLTFGYLVKKKNIIVKGRNIQ